MSEQRGTPDEQVQYWETMLQNYKARIAELEFKVKLGDDFKERAHYVAKATQAAWEETVAELEAENQRLSELGGAVADQLDECRSQLAAVLLKEDKPQ